MDMNSINNNEINEMNVINTSDINIINSDETNIIEKNVKILCEIKKLIDTNYPINDLYLSLIHISEPTRPY